jgi:acyl-coenzyme A synthetase/AMP-(fatty) acid ligase
MTLAQNYAFDVLESAARRPDAIALLAPDQTMTYGALRARIVRYALHMRLRGIGRRSCVALDANRMPEGPALALAAALLGARWVEMKPTVDPKLIGVTHVLTVNRDVTGPNTYFVDAQWTEHPGGFGSNEQIGFEGFGSEDDLAYYVESSGTTGRPKLMARAYEQALGSIERMRPYVGSSRVFTRFPPLAGAGFSFRVASFLEGGTVLVRNAVFQDLLHDSVGLVQGSPAQIDALCEGVTPGGRKIPRLLVWGAQMPPRLLRHWLQYFDEIDLGYGSREASGVGRMKVRTMPEDGIVEYVIDDGTEVQIIDDAGNSLPPNARGTVRIRNKSLARGYIGAPDASERAFRDGWFYPGDVGVLTSEGKLRLHGRLNDQFNFGGVKANAADVDEAALRVSGVKRAVSFAETNNRGVDELGLAVVLADGAEPAAAAQAIRQTCEAALGVALVPKAIYAVPDLPLNESGKEARATVRDLCAGRPKY